jgi:hypothetical protein
LIENEARTREAVERLAEAFKVEIDSGGDLVDNAELVALAVQGVFDDFVLHASWDAGPCVADVPLAYGVELACETHFGCDAGGTCADAAAGSVAPAPVLCGGECRGACAGDCTGVCLTPVDAAECEGSCYGACDISVTPAACEGTCYGECSGMCPVYNGSTGQCMGPCDGVCQGVCETLHDGEVCSGLCTGECGVETTAEAACEGGCIGTCDGECAGECLGPATPFCSQECDMTSACQKAARVVSWATPSSTWIEPLVVWYPYDDLETWTAPELADAFAVLDEELPALIAANAELRAIFSSGDYQISSIIALSGALSDFNGGGLGELGIPESEMDCVTGAVNDLAEIIAGFATRATPVIEAQIALLTVIEE